MVPGTRYLIRVKGPGSCDTKGRWTLSGAAQISLTGIQWRDLRLARLSADATPTDLLLPPHRRRRGAATGEANHPGAQGASVSRLCSCHSPPCCFSFYAKTLASQSAHGG